MPVLNVPFRLIFAMNPSRGRRARQQPAAREEVQVPFRGRLDILRDIRIRYRGLVLTLKGICYMSVQKVPEMANARKATKLKLTISTMCAVMFALFAGAAMAQTAPAPAPGTQKPTPPAPTAPAPAAPAARRLLPRPRRPSRSPRARRSPT